MRILLLSLCCSLLFTSCQGTAGQAPESSPQDLQTSDLSQYERAYFASGCFWCVEAIFESVTGVAEAISGYSGGHTDDPSYRSIGTGTTGHAETVEVYYDPELVSYETLLQVYYDSHDPTTVQGQAPDFGSQYRSIIFFQSPEEEQQALAAKERAQADHEEPIVTEIIALEKFYPAEDYHQDYERLHPNDGYVRNVSIPRLKRFQAKHPELLKKEH